jgi:hypothetical protein
MMPCDKFGKKEAHTLWYIKGTTNDESEYDSIRARIKY